MNTLWEAWEVDVRTAKGCTFFDDGICCHPNKRAASKIPCALDVEMGVDCPLERTPVIIRRTPDHIYEAVEEAIRNKP